MLRKNRDKAERKSDEWQPNDLFLQKMCGYAMSHAQELCDRAKMELKDERAPCGSPFMSNLVILGRP